MRQPSVTTKCAEHLLSKSIIHINMGFAMLSIQKRDSKSRVSRFGTHGHNLVITIIHVRLVLYMHRCVSASVQDTSLVLAPLLSQERRVQSSAMYARGHICSTRIGSF